MGQRQGPYQSLLCPQHHLGQGLVRSTSTHSVAVCPQARPLTSVPQFLICKMGKNMGQATPQLPAELRRVWVRLTPSFPQDEVTQGSGTASITKRALECRALWV